MFSNRCRCLACVFALGMVGMVGIAFAQEPAPASGSGADVEKAFTDLRDSENRTTQRFAERYLNLVRQQEWSNDSGSSKVLAKYLSHDPNLKWVKLGVVRGTGKDKSTREVTVPIDKLNKTCQSRVKQIATLQAKLAELQAAERESGTVGGEVGEYGGERGEAAPRERRGGYSGYDAPGSEAAPSEQPTEPPAAGPTTGDTGANDPDPLGFGELANEPPLEASGDYGGVPSGAAGTSGAGLSVYGGGEARVTPYDRSQWSTSYNGFHANFTSTASDGGVASIDWGSLADLREMNDAAAEHVRNSAADPYRSKISEIAERLGEVRWQGMFMGAEPQEAGGAVIRLNYQPLPEPLTIRFIADESEASRFSEVQRGQIVEFVGRFDIRTPNEIRVLIRLAN